MDIYDPKQSVYYKNVENNEIELFNNENFYNNNINNYPIRIQLKSITNSTTESYHFDVTNISPIVVDNINHTISYNLYIIPVSGKYINSNILTFNNSEKLCLTFMNEVDPTLFILSQKGNQAFTYELGINYYLSSKVCSYTYTNDYYYGTYDLYFSAYSTTCQLVIVAPSPTPTVSTTTCTVPILAIWLQALL